MYNPEQKQVILKNSFGVSYHVFYDSNRGLCLRMLSDSYIWSRMFVLASPAENDFSVTLDKDDFLHFVFQSREGSIMYGHGRHGQIEIKPILNSKDATPWPKYISLLISDDTVIVFYKIRYSGRHLISMQTITNDIISKPMAIDYADGSGSNYTVFLDNNGKCHIVYTITENSKTHLIYRELHEDYSIFSAPKRIYSSDGNILFPTAVADSDGKIHLLFQLHLDNSYETLYKNISLPKIEQTLYNGSTPPGYTGLLHKSGTLHSYRVNDSGIQFRSCHDGGKSWTDELPLRFGNGGELTCFIYNTNFKKERESFCSSEVPGDFSHGYRLAFLSDESASPEIADMPNHRNTSASAFDSFTKNEYTAKEKRSLNPDVVSKENAITDQSIKKIENKILQLQNITENMQRDLTKQWLLLKDFEKRLGRLIPLHQEYLNSGQNSSEANSEIQYKEEPYECAPVNESFDSHEVSDYDIECMHQP